MFLLIVQMWGFNTAEYSISIHLMFLLIKIRKGLNFLPSKISIHLMFLLILTRCQLQNETENYFNTSHVSINRLFQNSKETFPGISIHLMFLLIPDINQFKPSQATYFNTSHVSINRNADIRRSHRRKFQYISCFY